MVIGILHIHLFMADCNEKKVIDAMSSDIVKFVSRDRGVEITEYSTEFL